MSELVVLQHLEREGPGLFAEEAERRGWGVRVCRLDRGEPLPVLGPDQALLVLGGPMGVSDIGSPAFPWLAGEIALLQDCLECERPVIGLCLGAQLLAHAAGGRVVPLEAGDPLVKRYELGWEEVHWTVPVDQEPVLAGLEPSERMLHWHGDRILLPASATLLGSTALCPEQMYRIDHFAHGLQFHAEVTAEALERWLVEDGDYVALALGPDGAERVRQDQRRWRADCERQWRHLINNLLDRAQLLLGAYPLA